MTLKQRYICFTYAILLNILFNNLITAQNFEHIELVSGLSILEENNGVAVADIDGDFDLDIFVVAKGKEKAGSKKTYSRLFRNNNDGTFTDITTQSGLVNLFANGEIYDSHNGLDGSKYGAFWGDYDNDGFPDIFFTHSSKVQLFHNRGNGTFVEVTETAGINSDNDCKNTGATWFDYNNDGFLDLFIMGWTVCDNNFLYKNNSNGTFTNIPFESSSNEANFAMLPFDFNNDGWKDLYVPEDLFEENDLYINHNGTNFVEQASDYGLNSSIDDMGITMGDFNLDGYFDIFITGINQNVLYKNDGTNHFSEVSAKNNILGTGWAWGTKFADFDLDGDEDLFIVNGFILSKPQQSQYNVYYKNLYKEGKNIFEDASDDVNLGRDLTMSTEVADFDYDNDGDLDLFVTNADKASYFYRNRTINANEESDLNWFKVSLQGTTSNRDAFGTTVIIKTNNGTSIRYYSGVGFLSQSLKPVHFGLNKTNKIDELKILWTSGLIEIYHNINSNVLIKAIEGHGYEIINTKQSKEKIYGCTDPKSCTYNPLATVNDYSCEYIATGKITGKTNTGLNRTEDYTYSLKLDSQAIWTVEGGKIITGQGTNTISVKWGLEESGKVTVKEKTKSTCISSLSELNIDLNISRIFDNVSIARIWNEALLEAIRKDFARPTVHARNLFHTSIAIYDIYAIYDKEARPYLIGNTVNNFNSNIEEFIPLESTKKSRNKAISYAVYRLLTHRFKNSPGSKKSLARFDLIMNQLGYDINNKSVIYQSGNAAALGNYIGQTLINYGHSDKSRESSGYDNAFYEPVNTPLRLNLPEESVTILNPNHWQPLTFDTFIDQSGNKIDGKTPDFLSPEWGNVFPFALSDDDKQVFKKDGNDYVTYHSPGIPPQLSITDKTNSNDLYKWNFSLVSLWSSHLDPKDGVMWDISPKSIGNIDINSIPNSFSEYSTFYKKNGGDIGVGHTKNPITGQPYKTQMIPRGDYTRVLAEFWADGPDSETPPGHWFTILNYVNDHPLFIKKFRGQGKVLAPLEWDVKAYFILSGAMHDSAITAWGIKGWFDYIRPVSAIRYMSELGQSTDSNLANYHVGGIPLIPKFIEVIEEGDSLSGLNDENVDKIKIFAWKGHDFINNPKTDVAGVGWILAKNWWPYQRPSFVTPPFAGYISGHSTFSRAAAEVMALITGDEFFPGGMGEFVAKKDEFLAFEKGPSVDVVLQWATYSDASDQTSLSRIWGGIHPPADDLPGRLIGKKIGKDAFYFALPYFNAEGQFKVEEQPEINKDFLIYPNPTVSKEVYITNTKLSDTFNLFDMHGRSIPILENIFDKIKSSTSLKFLESTVSGVYILKKNSSSKLLIINK